MEELMMEEIRTQAFRKQRVLRVFVSSTFQDMKEEREELVKRVFPRLRIICEQRGVTWGEVDLRWGITNEQKAEGKVLPICLQEIHECRPYFICMLGERYGHIPKEIPPELIVQEPWLEEHKEKSVTELEVLHGVLNNPEMADHAYFYFRDPEYTESLHGEELPEQREKLDLLKERIRKSGLRLQENYDDPKTLGELVYEDLKGVIDQRFPEGSELDPLEKEASEHEAFAHAKYRVYIGRKDYFDRLDEHIEADDQPLIVLGESGSGKSALLANWAVNYRDKNPHDHMIMHFIGSTPYSSDWAAMLRRILGEFKRRFDIGEDIPFEPEKLRSAFANWLHIASTAVEKEGQKVILILDALNQLEDLDQAPDLVWLPPFIPENIRVILSTLPGRPLDDLEKRKWPVMLVEPLKDDERKLLIEEYLAQYRKTLSDSQIAKIASADQTGNPLYLRALLEELRVFGEHILLDERIDNYLEAENVPKLYAKIFERYEGDYERDRTGLVGDALTLIWASRRGLAETELLDLLGTNGESLPQAYWAPFYIATDKLFVNRSGLIGFSHDYQRQAITGRYLPTGDHQKSAHSTLAEYFSVQDISIRKVDELPWQLSEAGDWQQLYDLLSDLEFFKPAWDKDEFEVKGYWAKVENSSKMGLVDAFQSVLDAPDIVHDVETVIYIADLLDDTGHPSEALLLNKFLTEYYSKSGEYKKLADSLRYQGIILRRSGDLDGAMELHKESDHICRGLGDMPGLMQGLLSMGVIYFRRGDLQSSMKAYKESEHICRELGNRFWLSSILFNQANILLVRGELDGAMELYKECERTSRELGDMSSLSMRLINQGNVLTDQGDMDSAMILLKESEHISRRLGNKRSLSYSLGNQGIIYKINGDLDGAMELYKEQENICRELNDLFGIARSLGNQGVISKERGDLNGAMKLYVKQERIDRELGNRRGLSISLGNQGEALKELGQLDDAIILLKEVEDISRELEMPEILAESLAQIADVLLRKGSLKEAVSIAEESNEISTKHGYAEQIEFSRAILDKIHASLDNQTPHKL